MNFFKRLTGKSVSKSSDCCGVEIKEVESTQVEPCCGTSDINKANDQKTSCC